MWEIVFFLFVLYLLLFGISILKKDNSIADIFWGFGFFCVMWYGFLRFGSFSLSSVFVLSLVTLWSIRIVSYIASKKCYKKGEDARYAKWRTQWRFFYLRSFFQVYILQGLLLLGVATPIFIVLFSSGGENIFLTLFGGLVAFGGLLFETVSDIQLARFIKNKKPGEIYTTGLYRYSRHPNYFGESVFWLGITIISLSFSFWGIFGFLLITFLLLFVSGVPMLEKRYEGNSDYEAYKKKTSVFVPWFPKSEG